MSTVRVELLCPGCAARLEAEDLRPACSACGAKVELREGGGFESGGPIERCACCGAEALYIAKDFNKNLGPVLIGLGCIAFWWGPIAGVASLLALTLVDRVVYHLRPEVTVCYACKAVYRQIARSPKHLPYELTYDETFEGTGAKPPIEGGRAAAPGPAGS